MQREGMRNSTLASNAIKLNRDPKDVFTQGTLELEALPAVDNICGPLIPRYRSEGGGERPLLLCQMLIEGHKAAAAAAKSSRAAAAPAAG